MIQLDTPSVVSSTVWLWHGLIARRDVTLFTNQKKAGKTTLSDDGVTVYSIGLDEQDDGGRIIIGKSTNDPGQDIGFRLYNPDQRGLPAMPRTAKSDGFVFGPNGDLELAGMHGVEFGPEPHEVVRK